MNELPQVTRVRHDLRRRKLVVSRVETLAPGMRRVVLRGAELAGFTSLGFDDHVKLFFFTGGRVGGACGRGAVARSGRAEGFGHPFARRHRRARVCRR